MIVDITLGFIHKFRSTPFELADVDGSTTCGDLVEYSCGMHCHMHHTCELPTVQVVIDRTRATEKFDASEQKLLNLRHHFNWQFFFCYRLDTIYETNIPRQTKHIICIRTRSVN